MGRAPRSLGVLLMLGEETSHMADGRRSGCRWEKSSDGYFVRDCDVTYCWDGEPRGIRWPLRDAWRFESALAQENLAAAG